MTIGARAATHSSNGRHAYDARHAGSQKRSHDKVERYDRCAAIEH
jgi:hypothetical protein